MRIVCEIKTFLSILFISLFFFSKVISPSPLQTLKIKNLETTVKFLRLQKKYEQLYVYLFHGKTN